MTQYDFGTLNPASVDGVGLADLLNSWRSGLHSSHRGSARPAYAVAGMQWAKLVNGSRTDLMYYDGAVDIMLVSVNPSTGVVIDAAAFMRNASNLNAGTIPSARLVAADLMALIKGVDGAGTGLDADLLDGQEGAYYRNAGNINAGTLALARLPADVVQKSGTTFTGRVISKTIRDTTYNLTGTDVDPANGDVQYKTLPANTTLTESIAEGDIVELNIDDGTAYTITWFTVTWQTSDGLAPTLAAAGYNTFTFRKVNGVVLGTVVRAG